MHVISITIRRALREWLPQPQLPMMLFSLVVSLVPAFNFQDKVMAVKKIDAGSGPIVITPDGSETIDGTVSYTVSGQFTTVQIVSDGDGWWVI